MRLRTASPAAAAIPVQAKMPMFSCAYQGSGPASIATPVSPAIVRSPIRQVVGRSVREATVYRAITAHIATGARGSPVVSSSSDSPQVTASTARSRRRRSTSAAAPSSISSRENGSGVRVPKVGPCGPCGSAKDPTTMETNAPSASTASVASGCVRIHCLVGAKGPRSVVTPIRYGLVRIPVRLRRDPEGAGEGSGGPPARGTGRDPTSRGPCTRPSRRRWPPGVPCRPGCP